MKRKTMRALLCLMTLAAALWLLPVGAAAEITLKNNGYPYGKEMNTNSIKLAVEVENETTTIQYRWEKSLFIDFGYESTGETTATTNAFTPEAWSWYRCVVSDTRTGEQAISKDVMAVKPSTSTNAQWIWMKPYPSSSSSYNWYISNGIVAYTANGTFFDVTGMYEKEVSGQTKTYMLSTSYDRKWTMYSSTTGEPASVTHGNNNASAGNGDAQLDALRVSFDPNDWYTVVFEADLASRQQAFCLGADTQIDDNDRAALDATVVGGQLEQIALIATQNLNDIDTGVPAFTFKPVVDTPCSRFWIGNWTSSDDKWRAFVYNLKTDQRGYGVTRWESIGGEEYATQMQNQDSAMSVSWLNVSPGGAIKFKFSVGSVLNIGTVSVKIDYVAEKLKGLEANTDYNIQVDGTAYTLKTDADGCIPLAKQTSSLAYNFINKQLKIAKQGSSASVTVSVPKRPDASEPNDIERTESSISFRAVSGQEYKYSPDNGTNWYTLSRNEDGNCVISSLQSGQSVLILARKEATPVSFVSDWGSTSATTLREITVSGIAARDKTYDGTKNAALDYSGVSLSGKMDGDNLSVTANGEFDSADAGNNKTVTISGLTLTGNASGNYVLAATGQQTTASIIPREVTVTITPNGGVYGGTITPASAVLAGAVTGDNVPVTLTYQSATGYNSTTAPTEAGTYTVTASINNRNYVLTGTTTAEFVVSQSGTVFEALSVNGEGTSAEIAYGEPVTVTAKPKATGQAASSALYGLLRRNAPTQRQMALFIGDRQISGAVDADAASGVYTMTLDTKGKMLDVGVNSVEVRYMGDTNMADAAGRVTITLLQRPLTIAEATAEERVYDPASRTVRITGATLAGKALETDDVALDLTGLVGTLAGEGAGEYDELILPDALSLTGEHAAYYTVAGGQVRAAVRIGRAPLDLRVSIADWTVGDAPAEPTITGNLGGGAVRYAYKPRSAGDSEYSAEVPALAGSYTVRATVAQTANYLGAEATADFSILPKPAAMPETGDGSRFALWLALCLLAGAGTLALLRRRAEP